MSIAATFETPIALDRDTFMRRLIASFGHLNEGLLGSEVTGAYVMNVGLSMGAAIEAEYKRFWGIERPFTLDEYAHVIVDLKQKIHGNFSLVAKDADKVVVRTTSCPFDAFVRQSPSLCFMTSSVFGGIAARNFGYAKVVLHQRIALGDPGCHVTVHLRRTPEAEAAVGREYYPDVDQASPDIAEQLRLMESVRRLRRELSESASRWEEVVHGAAEAVGVLQADGRVAFANARWRDLAGVEPEEFVGAALDRLVHPDDQPAARAAVERMLAGQRVVGAAVRVLHRTGAWREVVLSGGPIRDESGRLSGALTIARDVTEEREAQRLKDDFLTSASHELRTPVATIKGLTDLLLHRIAHGTPPDPQQLAARLETIRRETDRLALLGRDLVDVARLQTGRLSVALVPEDLNAVAEAAVVRARALLAARPGGGNGQPAVEICFQAAAGPVPVAAERARLAQVIDNLLENAVKYSPGGEPVAVTVAVEDGHGIVRVSDRGIGIPAADVARLFTPFFRASNASTSNFPGLGLGLYLCRMILDAHGGTLAVESAEGQGATFTLALPLARPEPEQDPTAAESGG